VSSKRTLVDETKGRPSKQPIRRHRCADSCTPGRNGIASQLSERWWTQV